MPDIAGTEKEKFFARLAFDWFYFDLFDLENGLDADENNFNILADYRWQQLIDSGLWTCWIPAAGSSGIAGIDLSTCNFMIDRVSRINGPANPEDGQRARQIWAIYQACGFAVMFESSESTRGDAP